MPLFAGLMDLSVCRFFYLFVDNFGKTEVHMKKSIRPYNHSVPNRNTKPVLIEEKIESNIC